MKTRYIFLFATICIIKVSAQESTEINAVYENQKTELTYLHETEKMADLATDKVLYSTQYDKYMIEKKDMQHFESVLNSAQNKEIDTSEVGIGLTGGHSFMKGKRATSGKSFWYLGGNIVYSDKQKYPSGGENVDQITIGAGTYYGTINDKKKWFGEANISYNYGSAFFYGTKLSITGYAINPSLEVNLINFLRINLGYNFPIGKKDAKEQLKGLTLSISISAGIGDYYPNLSN